MESHLRSCNGGRSPRAIAGRSAIERNSRPRQHHKPSKTRCGDEPERSINDVQLRFFQARTRPFIMRQESGIGQGEPGPAQWRLSRDGADAEYEGDYNKCLTASATRPPI